MRQYIKGDKIKLLAFQNAENPPQLNQRFVNLNALRKSSVSCAFTINSPT